MPTLYLVRHGRAAAAWDKDADPGLDDLGRQQARAAAEILAPRGPLHFLVSPMRRTRETAQPLSDLWGVAPRIEPRVSEIPSPMTDLAARGLWLREIAARDWRTLDAPLRQWRAELIATLAELDRDSVIVTHYIAINLAVGAATGDVRVVNFRPDYCSITMLRPTGTSLEVIQLGGEGTTQVL